jgi:hypothetical protein
MVKQWSRVRQRRLKDAEIAERQAASQETKAVQQQEMYALGVPVHLKVYQGLWWTIKENGLACGTDPACAVAQVEAPQEATCPDCLVWYDEMVSADLVGVKKGKLVDFTL